MNTENIRPVELENEDIILAFTHNKRKTIVDTLMAKGVPDDVETIKVLLSTLKDMDSQTLTRKRIKTDERTNDVQAQSAAVIAKILGSMPSSGDMVNAEFRVIPTLPDHVPRPTLVDGETDLLPSTQTYSEFIETFIDTDA